MATRTSGAVAPLRDVCADHFCHERGNRRTNAVIRFAGAGEGAGADNDMKGSS